MSELELIERIRKQAGKASRMTLGIGDDCAIYSPQPGEELLFTTDLFIEDVHFLTTTHKPADIGHKTLVRGLSDIAAMGGTPRFFLLSLAIPSSLTKSWIDRFYRSLLATAHEYKVQLAGGDTSHHSKIICDIIVCGSVPKGTALRRDGAKPGDSLYVSNLLGGSALGLQTKRGAAWKKHIHPEPRLRLGQILREKYHATACMDLSDGLSIDLHRLCKASKVSADLDGMLPMFPGSTPEQMLHGGEDYELLFTVSPDTKLPASIAGSHVHCIGIIRKGKPGRIAIDEFELLPLGYDHFRTT